MTKGFTGVFVATLLLLMVACSGSDDDALAECISVLADVTRDHIHKSASTNPNASSSMSSGVIMPQPFPISGSSPDDLIDEKCAPFLSASRAADVGSQQTPEGVIEYPAIP